MEITYKTKKLEKICTDARIAEKTHGREMADKIHQRIDEISAADGDERRWENRGAALFRGRRRALRGQPAADDDPETDGGLRRDHLRLPLRRIFRGCAKRRVF